MKPWWMKLPITTMAPEAGGEPAPEPSGKGEDPAPAPAGSDGAGEPAGGSEDPAPSKPENVPDKFWDAENGQVKVDELARSYSEAEKKLYTRSDDLKKQLAEEMKSQPVEGVPEKPDGYQVNVPKDLAPEGYELTVPEDDPLVGWFREFAHEHQLPQESFDRGVQAYLEMQMQQMPDWNEAAEQLGEQAEERVDRVANWLQANLGEQFQALANLPITADRIEAFEALMELAGEPAFQVMDGGEVKENLSREDLMAMMNDPRYYNGQDRAFVKKVQNGWKRLSQQG